MAAQRHACLVWFRIRPCGLKACLSFMLYYFVFQVSSYDMVRLYRMQTGSSCPVEIFGLLLFSAQLSVICQVFASTDL